MAARKFLLFTAFMLAAVSAVAGGDDALTAAYERQNLLRAELSAAQTGKFYVVVDLENASFLLKNRGVVFKEWKAISAEYWGTALPLEATALTKREAPDSPERTQIVPETVDENGLNAEGKVPPLPDPLEVVDMPEKFDLVFPKDVTISISAPHEPTGDRLTDYKDKFGLIKERFVRNLKLPFFLKEKKEKNENFARINLVMKKEDAKALYWAFPEGTTTIFTQNALR